MPTALLDQPARRAMPYLPDDGPITAFREAPMSTPPRYVPPPREAWLLTRRQQRKDLPIRTVAEYITKIFATERALFEE